MITTTTAGRILRRDYLKQRKLVRRWLIFFIIALVFSGLTAFALQTGLSWLLSLWPGFIKGGAYNWVKKVYEALRDINDRYPFLAYGYDWLAFAHLVIAVAFVGVLCNPVRNKWI